MAHHEAAGMHTRMGADVTSAPSIRRQTLIFIIFSRFLGKSDYMLFFTNWIIVIHLSPKYLSLFFKGVLMIGWRRVSLSLKIFTKTGIESRYTDLKNFSLQF